MTSDSRGGLARLLLALLLLALGVGAALMLMVVLGVLSPGQVAGRWDPALRALEAASSGDWTDRLMMAGISGAVGLFSLTWLLRLLGGPRRNIGVHLLTADSQGFVVVDSKGVATIAAQAARSTAGVVEATAIVSGVGTEPVRLKIDVGVHPGANIKEAGDQARRRVHETVERLVGIEVKDVAVSVRVMEADQLSRLLA